MRRKIAEISQFFSQTNCETQDHAGFTVIKRLLLPCGWGGRGDCGILRAELHIGSKRGVFLRLISLTFANYTASLKKSVLYILWACLSNHDIKTIFMSCWLALDQALSGGLGSIVRNYSIKNWRYIYRKHSGAGHIHL